MNPKNHPDDRQGSVPVSNNLPTVISNTSLKENAQDNNLFGSYFLTY
jgi:hypothetical protein